MCLPVSSPSQRVYGHRSLEVLGWWDRDGRPAHGRNGSRAGDPDASAPVRGNPFRPVWHARSVAGLCGRARRHRPRAHPARRARAAARPRSVRRRKGNGVHAGARSHFRYLGSVHSRSGNIRSGGEARTATGPVAYPTGPGRAAGQQGGMSIPLLSLAWSLPQRDR